MKIVIAFLVVCLLGLISAEDCPTNNPDRECDHMKCEDHWHKACVSSTCTCLHSTDGGQACTSKAECDAINGWSCSNSRRHCVDGRCRCSRF
ncbi:serine protease inhibitor Cvsi-2-like [Mytilus trossulus]|uniref:serine protease inhibitor Cvsi-2-like n=1 Tax=Mytilus trossulus TaxID=6551 RepID=UPI003006C1CB